MDSLTQIVLGAAIGEAVAGRKFGAKAALWGAVAGTLPDLDVFLRSFYHPMDAALVHRGLSHSLFFALTAGPLLGLLFHRIYKKKYEQKDWIWLWFLGIVTHPMLDMFTNYGTQFFWPFDARITFNTVFVIDPIYTVPFMICVIVAISLNKQHRWRSRWNWGGIIWSSSYLIWGVVLKLFFLSNATHYFEKEGITVKEPMVTPMPLTSFYWEFIAQDDSNYYVGYKSIFGGFSTKKEIEVVPKNHQLLSDLKWKEKNRTEQMIYLTNGYYALQKSSDTLKCYDLRFGTLTQLTAGNQRQPLMGYGFVVDNNFVQKCFPLQRINGVNGRTFATYIDKVFAR